MLALKQSEVKKLFNYNPTTGILTRKLRTSNRIKIGDVAGSPNTNGYLQVRINGIITQAHRIIYCWMYGDLESGHIDHINHIRDDNRIENLRLVTISENLKNKSIRKDNTSEACGVSLDKRHNTWKARIHANGKRIHLGDYKDKELAIFVRKEAEEVYGYHKNHGKEVVC